MRRWMAVALVLAFSGCASVRVPIAVVSFDYPTIALMADIEGQFNHETAACLLGYVNGDDGTLQVEGMTAATINVQDSVSVSFDGCVSPLTIGWYHNHPGEADNCYPSDTDLNTSAHDERFLLMLISCADEMRPGFVYMVRGDKRLYHITPAQLDSLAASAQLQRPEGSQ